MTQRRQRVVHGWRLILIVSAVALAGVSALTVSSAVAQDKHGAGLVVSDQATAEDVGLPIYPGAKPHKDAKDDSEAARLGIWGGGFGFRIAALKMESNDTPAQVAEFYKKALAKYGNVLDCTGDAASNHEKNDSSAVLTCGDDKPDKGGLLLKVGTKEKQHIVAVEPNGKGAIFSLVYFWVKGH